MDKSIKVSEAVYNNLKLASQKTRIPIKSIADLCITRELNLLNDPENLLQLLGMVKEGK